MLRASLASHTQLCRLQRGTHQVLLCMLCVLCMHLLSCSYGTMKAMQAMQCIESLHSQADWLSLAHLVGGKNFAYRLVMYVGWAPTRTLLRHVVETQLVTQGFRIQKQQCLCLYPPTYAVEFWHVLQTIALSCYHMSSQSCPQARWP